MPDRVVVVTGGFGVLGRAVVQAFEATGARVAALDRSSVGAVDAARAGDSYLPLGDVDLTRLDHAEKAIDTVVRRFGRLDVLVNIAGGFTWQTLGDGDVEAWDRMFTINLKTAVVITKAALGTLVNSASGRVINVGAGAAAKAAAGMGPYTASKSAVQRLTESLSEELKDRGITVNCVLPGTIDTPQNRADMPDADHSRWVPAEAIADVIVFLASTSARAVTGAAVPVFGRG